MVNLSQDFVSISPMQCWGDAEQFILNTVATTHDKYAKGVPLYSLTNSTLFPSIGYHSHWDWLG